MPSHIEIISIKGEKGTSKARIGAVKPTSTCAYAEDMGKSIRSKIKKKFRTIKREIVDPFYTDKLKICLEDAPLAVRPAETPESYARRNDPRKKDPRLGCAAFALAFPGGVTGDENRRGGIGNHPSHPPVELEKKKVAESEEYERKQRAEFEEGRRAAAEERARLADKMVVEGPVKLIKKRKLKGNRTRSDSSFKRSN